MNSDFASTVQALCLIIITALLAFSLAVPARVEESAEQQWEYLIQSVPDLQFTDMMTLYGRDGWELVFARRAVIARSARERLQARRTGRDFEEEFAYEIIFKRPARDTPATGSDLQQQLPTLPDPTEP